MSAKEQAEHDDKMDTDLEHHRLERRVMKFHVGGTEGQDR